MIKYKIGHQLKEVRSTTGWSLSRAADETGVSKAMLGQIERNESSPTIATLWKIATGFHKPLSLFIDGLLIEDSDEKVQKKTTEFNPQKHDLKAKVLFPFDPRFGFEMFTIKLEPLQVHLSEAHDKGVFEHVLVISGELEVKLKGAWKKLSKNEVLRFSADQAHGYRNTSDTIPVEFHNMIFYQ